MGHNQPIRYRCSRCGGSNAGALSNNAGIVVKCFECGHILFTDHARWRRNDFQTIHQLQSQEEDF
ncbi:MAG: hypothetical protein JXB25_12000 [Deltaproteobacteria bacterium]|nr:hypothetical protein [Deltaproteobacteria bacterium]